MPATQWLVGATHVAERRNEQVPAANIDAAARAVVLPAQWGRWLGPLRITREVYQNTFRERAVGVWVLTDWGVAHRDYVLARVREQFTAALNAMQGLYGRWVARPLVQYFPEVHGSETYWSSGQAAQTRTREPFSLTTELNELEPESAEGTSSGATVTEGARETAAQLPAAVVTNYWPWLLLGGIAVYAVSSLQGPRRMDNPAPKLWDELPAGTPYKCKSKQVGRTIDHGRFADFVVKTCATPLPETAEQRQRRTKPRREAAFVLQEHGKGPEVVAPGSVVREGLRTPRATIGEAPQGGVEGIRAQAASMRRHIREQEQAGAYFPEPPGLPYPARVGSSPCLPGAPVWRELEGATMERVAIMEEAGAPITRETLSAAMQGSSAFEQAARTENECIARYWERAARSKAPKAVLSRTREVALAREAAKAAGVDLQSAEYRDTLEGEQLAKQRSRRRQNAAATMNPCGCQQENPSQKVTEALLLHDGWRMAGRSKRQELASAKHALLDTMSNAELDEYNREQQRLHSIERRSPSQARKEWQALRENPLEYPKTLVLSQKEVSDIEHGRPTDVFKLGRIAACGRGEPVDLRTPSMELVATVPCKGRINPSLPSEVVAVLSNSAQSTKERPGRRYSRKNKGF